MTGATRIPIRLTTAAVLIYLLGVHPVAGLTDVMRAGQSASARIGATSIAWYVATPANRGSLSVVRLADLRWP